MSRSARITLPFDRSRDFRLGIGELEELERLCDAGPEELYAQIGLGRWRTRYLTEILRLGLIGAGTPVTEAGVLVERYAGPGNLLEWKQHCRAILMAAMAGHEDDGAPTGEQTGEAVAATTGSPEESSGSPPSTN